MRVLIEGFAYCTTMALICFITIEMFVMHKQIANANDYYDYIKETVVVNQFESETLEKLKKEAGDNGYTLSFDDTNTSDYYWMELEYNIQINLIGVSSSDTIKGYIKVI